MFRYLFNNETYRVCTMKKSCWILLLLAFWSVNSFALDGNGLLQLCNNAVNVINNNGYATNTYQIGDQLGGSGECLGYVQAIVESFGGYAFCPPSAVTYGQMVRITTKFLNNHPEKLNQPGVVLVISALSKAFPCLKPNSK
jgi:hypothetical protein